MSYHNISAQISESVLGEIKTCLNDARSRMPFLVTLSGSERRKLFKLGQKSLAFVEDSLVAAKNHPEILPASFDLVEYEKDVRLAIALHEVLMELEKFAAEVDDTEMAVGSEALDESREVYGYVKAASRRVPGLKSLAAQLGTRFVRSSRDQAAAAPAKERS